MLAFFSCAMNIVTGVKKKAEKHTARSVCDSRKKILLEEKKFIFKHFLFRIWSSRIFRVLFLFDSLFHSFEAARFSYYFFIFSPSLVMMIFFRDYLSFCKCVFIIRCDGREIWKEKECIGDEGNSRALCHSVLFAERSKRKKGKIQILFRWKFFFPLLYLRFSQLHHKWAQKITQIHTQTDIVVRGSPFFFSMNILFFQTLFPPDYRAHFLLMKCFSFYMKFEIVFCLFPVCFLHVREREFVEVTQEKEVVILSSL